METWETIRLRCRRDKEQIKPLARELGIAPNTVRKYLRSDTPPKRAATPRAKLLDPYQSHIDALLQSTPKITAKRIGSYLRQNVDAEIAVDERTLRQYVADRRSILVPKEAFIRASYAPGDQSQFDFSPMPVYLGGILVKVELFVVRLSYSSLLCGEGLDALRSAGALCGIAQLLHGARRPHSIGDLRQRIDGGHASFTWPQSRRERSLCRLSRRVSVACRVRRTGEGQRKRWRRGCSRLHRGQLLPADAVVRRP